MYSISSVTSMAQNLFSVSFSRRVMKTTVAPWSAMAIRSHFGCTRSDTKYMRLSPSLNMALFIYRSASTQSWRRGRIHQYE
ncbi:hypothetical protein RSAG8_13818, partial [Rhizoctonia solani AG-8 WAC10335]